jgi:rhodanese-related sulfurtransferase
MKSILRITVVSILALTTIGLRAQTLSPQEFESKMKVSKGITLLDVRTADEFGRGHLPNAVLLDYYRNDFKDQLSRLDKNKPVFVYCASGGRSHSTCSLLKDQGFTQVFDLQGGFRAWTQAKKPAVK